MAKKGPRACHNKAQFPDAATAVRKRLPLLTEGNIKKGDTRLRIYRCGFCSYYHMGRLGGLVGESGVYTREEFLSVYYRMEVTKYDRSGKPSETLVVGNSFEEFLYQVILFEQEVGSTPETITEVIRQLKPFSYQRRDGLGWDREMMGFLVSEDGGKKNDSVYRLVVIKGG